MTNTVAFLDLIYADLDRLDWCLGSGVPVPDSGYETMFFDHALSVGLCEARKKFGDELPDDFWTMIVAAYGPDHFCAARSAFSEARDSGRWDLLELSGSLVVEIGRKIDAGFDGGSHLFGNWGAVTAESLLIADRVISVLEEAQGAD